MIKLLIYTGLRNAELARVRLQDVDLDYCQLHIVQGKNSKDRSVLFPSSFRGEFGQYIHGHRERGAVFLFESNRLRPYSTRRVRQIIHQYAAAAGIEKEKSLAIYRDLALADVSAEYEQAMRSFLVR
jgi:integrase/recombinase XerD